MSGAAGLGATGVSAALAAFVAETPAAAIPALVRRNAVDTIVDAYATAQAGQLEPTAATIRDSVLPRSAPGRARVLGAPDARVEASAAALVNGATAHCLDYDAISFAVSGFVGSAMLAALAALAEEADTPYPGTDVVTAYCLGWEAAAAIARAVNPEHYAIGWHPTATMSGYAATAACARLLGLDAERTLAALSIATSETSGVKIMIGNMINAYHVGKAARNGINAARLAADGFVGHPDPMEADQGFFAQFAGPAGARPERTTATLGRHWDLTEPGPVFKIYACCGLVHSGLDAAIALRDEEGISPDEILDVEVLVHEFVPRVMHVDRPDTGYAAKFCIPYCIAAGLRDGRAGLAPFDRVDEDLVELGRRVRFGVHPDLHGGDTFFAKEFTEVRVSTTRGVFERRVNRLSNRGSGSLATATLADKFAECVARPGTVADPGADLDRLLGSDSHGGWALWSM
ncbi:MmgE/PrpD family protein [Pseudonocardia sp. GCM10023141]|uniref:MmgE/PrpD family protein n=1 Tax=Pseudonocardia sp. GCM10023141 TaxID=3252653 RepID=UPI003612BD89